MAASADALSAPAPAAGLELLARLPDWLVAAVDGERVRHALTREAPELAAAGLAITGCQPKRLRLKDDRWVVFYQLRVEGPGSGDIRVLGLTGTLDPPGADRATPVSGRDRPSEAFGSPDWSCVVPDLGLRLRSQPEDAALPAVPVLTDPGRAAAFLQAAIAGGSPAYADLRVAGCEPEVLRYKPGSRCTVRYRMAYPSDAAGRGWPATVVAKTYRGDKGRNADAGMRRLWSSPLRSGDVVAIAEPLGYDEDLRVLLQGPVPGRDSLKDLLRRALASGTDAARGELEAALRATASGLAALHTCGAEHGELVTFDDEAAEVRELVARLAGPIFAVGDALAPLLADLSARADSLPAEPPVPSHRSFRPAQVLLDGGRIAFIDFDGMCRAEPALDLALFRATFTSIGLSTPWRDGRPVEARLRELHDLGELFLAEYRAVAPVDPRRVALWEALDLLANALHCWTKIRPYRLDTSLLALRVHLRALGIAGA